MINEFPEDYELLSFFESEPQVLDKDLPWIYNTLTFDIKVNDENIIVSISPSYGDIDLTIIKNKVKKVQLSIHDIDSIIIDKHNNKECLHAKFSDNSKFNDFYLFIKPESRIIWGTDL